ncbi:MAG TPA: FMN-dependent NADH-azoreductase [Woeseiaceae bacterium]
MKTLLRIQASLYGAEGASSRLADAFEEQWRRENPDGRVVLRDVAAEPLPHLDLARFQSLLAHPAERTPPQQAVSNQSDALITELLGADTVVIAVPMYNFGVPTQLKAWFDHIVRAGVTFRYTEAGPQGLVTGKKAYVFIARGGHYGEMHAQTAWLRQILAFIGIEDVEFVHAEGLAIDEATRESALAEARRKIARLVRPARIAAA